jgi:hypothetical protein
MSEPSKKYVVTPMAGGFVAVRMTEADWKEIQELLALSRNMLRGVAHEDVCNRITKVLDDGLVDDGLVDDGLGF